MCFAATVYGRPFLPVSVHGNNICEIPISQAQFSLVLSPLTVIPSIKNLWPALPSPRPWPPSVLGNYLGTHVVYDQASLPGTGPPKTGDPVCLQATPRRPSSCAGVSLEITLQYANDMTNDQHTLFVCMCL